MVCEIVTSHLLCVAVKRVLLLWENKLYVFEIKRRGRGHSAPGFIQYILASTPGPQSSYPDGEYSWFSSKPPDYFYFTL